MIEMIEMKKKLWIGCIMVLLCTIVLGMTTFAAGAKTMKNKKWISGKGGVCQDEDNDGKKEALRLYDMQYYKIQIPKQGYIMVDVKQSPLPGWQEYLECNDPEEDDPDGLYVKLLNAKKKDLAGYRMEESNQKFSWAVKKGTYYLAVTEDVTYKLRYTFTPVPKVSKAGQTIEKAATIKKGTAIKNLLFDDNYQNYYKFQLNKKTKVVLVCDSKIIGGDYEEMTVQIWTKKGKDYRQVNTKGKILSKNSTYGFDVEGKKTITYTLPKGTYYLRTFALGSGYYTIKWK